MSESSKEYGLRPGAEEFPLMVVLSIIYPCNFGCPNCPYTDGNSEIRRFYRERQGDLFPVALWRRIADECGEYGAWMRCTILSSEVSRFVETVSSEGLGATGRVEASRDLR